MAAGEGLEADEFIRTVAGTGFPLNQGLSARSRWGRQGWKSGFELTGERAGEERNAAFSPMKCRSIPPPAPLPTP